MDLISYLRSHDLTHQAFAEAIGESRSLVTRIISGNRRPSWRMAIKIEAATQGAVSCRDLRPDIYSPEGRAA